MLCGPDPEHGMDHPLDRWHDMVARRDPNGLDALLADDVVFHSPVVHTPQRGRARTRMYLLAAFQVLLGDDFRYVREIRGEHDAMLEFTVELDGIHVNGVDIMHFDDEGRIDDFTVMVRPMKAMDELRRRMAELLEAQG
jgi:hypothetical protein